MKQIPQATRPLICLDGPTKVIYSFNGLYQGSAGGMIESTTYWGFLKGGFDIVAENATSNPGFWIYNSAYAVAKGRFYWNYSTDYLIVTRAQAGASMLLGLTSGYFDKPMGFNGTAGVAKPTITGSRGGNAALASLLTALAATGLLTDSTTA